MLFQIFWRGSLSDESLSKVYAALPLDARRARHPCARPRFLRGIARCLHRETAFLRPSMEHLHVLLDLLSFVGLNGTIAPADAVTYPLDPHYLSIPAAVPDACALRDETTRQHSA